MFSMKEACAKTGLSYETLKFYCNQGLVPNVGRDGHNFRVFEQWHIDWINNLCCLRNCGMSIPEMREYIALCMQGDQTIPTRKEILQQKRNALLADIRKLQDVVEYIDWKQGFYDDTLAGRTPKAPPEMVSNPRK